MLQVRYRRSYVLDKQTEAKPKIKVNCFDPNISNENLPDHE